MGQISRNRRGKEGRGNCEGRVTKGVETRRKARNYRENGVTRNNSEDIGKIGNDTIHEYREIREDVGKYKTKRNIIEFWKFAGSNKKYRVDVTKILSTDTYSRIDRGKSTCFIRNTQLRVTLTIAISEKKRERSITG